MSVAFRHLIGILFLLYALAFASRPASGSIGYIYTVYNISPAFVIALFAASACVLLVVHVTPPLVALLSLPLALLALAALIFAVQTPTVPFSAALSHAAVEVLILAWVSRKVGNGDYV